MAVGYFLIAQRFADPKVSDSKKQEVAVSQPSPQSTPSPSVLGTDTTDATKSAYQRIAERTKGGVETLPATGFPAVLFGVFSLGAIAVGFGLRRFPK